MVTDLNKDFSEVIEMVSAFFCYFNAFKGGQFYYPSAAIDLIKADTKARLFNGYFWFVIFKMTMWLVNVDDIKMINVLSVLIN